MTKYFLFFALNLLLLNSNVAQSYAIQLGYTRGDLSLPILLCSYTASAGWLARRQK
jgi:hypothetical protein